MEVFSLRWTVSSAGLSELYCVMTLVQTQLLHVLFVCVKTIWFLLCLKLNIEDLAFLDGRFIINCLMSELFWSNFKNNIMHSLAQC